MPRKKSQKESIDSKGYDADIDEQNALLSKFKTRFRKKLVQATKSPESHKNVHLHFRRLDSLARLLEGKATCAAVYYNALTNRLWIANNKIFNNSRETNNYIKNLNDAFHLISQEDISIKDILDKLSKIILANYEVEHRYKIRDFKENNIDLAVLIENWLKDLFISALTTKEWENQIAEKLESDSTSQLKLHVVNRLVKLTRDFLKIRAYLLSTKTRNAISDGILLAIKNNHYDIMHDEGKDVHAEMRILSNIYNSEDVNHLYIGISKLCCAHCARAIKAFNLECRGLHGQVYNWPVPDFISNSALYLKTFVGKRSYKAYKKMKQESKKEALQFIASKESCPKSKPRSMYADSSDSDIEFGLHCDEGPITSPVKNMPLANIWTIRHIKMCYEDEFYFLSEIGLSIHQILDLYKTKSKFFDLATKKVFEICNKLAKDELDAGYLNPKNIFERLCGLYDKDLKFYKHIIDDNGEGAYAHLLDELFAKYQSLGRNYDAAINFFIKDKGWDLSSHSNESQYNDDDQNSQASEICIYPDNNSDCSRANP